MSFVNDFTDYLKTRTDCPPVFFPHAALCALSVALGNAVSTPGWGRPLYPNLFLLMIAPSGYGKSVPLDFAEMLLQSAGLGQHILENSGSQEGLLSSIAAQPVGVFIQQEFGAFMEMLNRDYNRGLMQTLTELYDAPAQWRRKLRQEPFTINNPTLSILAASSPDWFAEAFKASALRGGFLARFVFCPSAKAGAYVGDPGPNNPGIEASLADHLRVAGGLAGSFDFAPVREKFNEWDRVTRHELRSNCPPEFAGLRSRMGALVKKTTILFHVSEDPESIHARTADLDRAIKYVEWAQTMAEDYLTNHVAHDAHDQQRMRVMEKVEQRGGRISRKDLLRATRMDARDLDRSVKTLEESHQLKHEMIDRTLYYYVPPSLNGTAAHLPFSSQSSRELAVHPVN